MTAEQAYLWLIDEGFFLYGKDGKLMVSPSEKLTEGRIEVIKAHRDALLALASRPIWMLWQDGRTGQRLDCLDGEGWPEGVVAWQHTSEKLWHPVPGRESRFPGMPAWGEDLVIPVTIGAGLGFILAPPIRGAEWAYLAKDFEERLLSGSSPDLRKRTEAAGGLVCYLPEAWERAKALLIEQAKMAA